MLSRTVSQRNQSHLLVYNFNRLNVLNFNQIKYEDQSTKMGIKELWTILGPFCERKPLFELQGKTVAIDLSCWVCEAQNIAEYQVQPRMYLRNLYFRTCYLLLLEVNPVFVLDGKAPTLKYKTIAARNAIQFKGAKPKTDSKAKQGSDRSRFNYVLKQCEQMLKLMGIACIKGHGEAEALCAHLNSDGLVDGCITQDSDCFAYGAKTVYRNFSISQQGLHAAAGGAVDVYDIEKLTKDNGIGRNKVIALALLCGSDYNDGVFGVGKDSVLKLFNEVSENDILNRLRSWKDNHSYYQDLEHSLSDKSICKNCGHTGRLQLHTKIGCKDCKKVKGCLESDFKIKQQRIKNELNMRKKALENIEFPNEDIIQEFLQRKDSVQSLNLKWAKPDMRNFVHFARDYLQWEESYTVEKFLPILTRWQIANYTEIENQVYKTSEGIQCVLLPDYIKKIRNPKGIPSYEIVWTDKNNFFQDLIPKEQLDGIDTKKLWSTVEPQHLVEKAYPDLVEQFRESKINAKKPSKRKIKKPGERVSKPAKQKCSKPSENISKQKTLDTYFKQAITNRIKEKNKIEENFVGFDLDMSNFGDEQDSDLSDIVEDIVSHGEPNYVKKHLQKFYLKMDHSIEQNLNISSFFTLNCSENDLFEKTFNQSSSENEQCEDSEEMFEQDIEDQDGENINDDSFVVNCIPLLERIKNKTATDTKSCNNILHKSYISM